MALEQISLAAPGRNKGKGRGVTTMCMLEGSTGLDSIRDGPPLYWNLCHSPSPSIPFTTGLDNDPIHHVGSAGNDSAYVFPHFSSAHLRANIKVSSPMRSSSVDFILKKKCADVSAQEPTGTGTLLQ